MKEKIVKATLVAELMEVKEEIKSLEDRKKLNADFFIEDDRRLTELSIEKNRIELALRK